MSVGCRRCRSLLETKDEEIQRLSQQVLELTKQLGRLAALRAGGPTAFHMMEEVQRYDAAQKVEEERGETPEEREILPGVTLRDYKQRFDHFFYGGEALTGVPPTREPDAEA